MRLRGLYAITPERADLARVAEALGSGALCALQYRSKTADRARRRDEARLLALLCRRHGVPLIINDDVELALEVGAEGVHLGREDGSVAAARARLPGRIIGASCYDRLELAERAVAAGADYVAFGSVYASITKPGAVRAPLALFGHDLSVAKVAIGGITAENAAPLVAAGANALAVISDLFDAPDVAARAREYAKVFAHDHA
jgi:thiamine-phosphate pyrophosphorylase